MRCDLGTVLSQKNFNEMWPGYSFISEEFSYVYFFMTVFDRTELMRCG